MIVQTNENTIGFHGKFTSEFNGTMYEVDDFFSTTSFTTANRTTVLIDTTSSSTGAASVKMTQGPYQILWRFPNF